MKKGKLPTVKVQQNTVQLLAFYPNPRGGKNSAYVIVFSDPAITIDKDLIRPDDTGKFLFINEMALTISSRISLHRQTREQKGNPLIFDERVKSVRIAWE